MSEAEISRRACIGIIGASMLVHVEKEEKWPRMVNGELLYAPDETGLSISMAESVRCEIQCCIELIRDTNFYLKERRRVLRNLFEMMRYPGKGLEKVTYDACAEFGGFDILNGNDPIVQDPLMRNVWRDLMDHIPTRPDMLQRYYVAQIMGQMLDHASIKEEPPHARCAGGLAESDE